MIVKFYYPGRPGVVEEWDLPTLWVGEGDRLHINGALHYVMAGRAFGGPGEVWMPVGRCNLPAPHRRRRWWHRD